MEGVLMWDHSNGLPIESFFESLDATNIMGVEADERLELEKSRPTCNQEGLRTIVRCSAAAL